MIQNRFLRTLVFSLGICAVFLSVVGVFLPVLPTTPFVLLAAWCFLKSSQRAYEWLHSQPYLGPALRDWEERKAISRHTKIFAISMMIFSLALIWWKVAILPLKIGVSLLLGSVALFIATRPE